MQVEQEVNVILQMSHTHTKRAQLHFVNICMYVFTSDHCECDTEDTIHTYTFFHTPFAIRLCKSDHK